MVINVNGARKLLGAQGKRLSDEDISQLLSQFYELADVIANTVISRGSNKTNKGVDLAHMEGQNE